MSDSIKDWLSSDQLLLVVTDVRNRLNVQTVVTKTGTQYRVYAFSDHPTEHAGPVAVDEYPLPSEDIVSALEKEHVVTINSPGSVRVTWNYERVGEHPVGMLDQIRVSDQNGREFVLTSDGADYPTALLLDCGDAGPLADHHERGERLTR